MGAASSLKAALTSSGAAVASAGYHSRQGHGHTGGGRAGGGGGGGGGGGHMGHGRHAMGDGDDGDGRGLMTSARGLYVDKTVAKRQARWGDHLSLLSAVKVVGPHANCHHVKLPPRHRHAIRTPVSLS